MKWPVVFLTLSLTAALALMVGWLTHARAENGWQPRQAAPAVAPPQPAQPISNGWRPRQSTPAVQPVGANDRPLVLPALKMAAAVEDDEDAPRLPLPRKVQAEQPAPAPRRLPAPGGAPDQRALEKAALLGAARNAVRRDDLEEAARRFEQYLLLEPDDDAVRREYAGILIQSGRYRPAIEQMREMLSIDPDNTALRMLLADVFLLQKDYVQAATELQAALDRDPINLEVAARRARVATFLGDFARAKAIYEQYFDDLKPEDPRVPTSFGALLVDLERAGEAVDFLRVQRRRDPEDLELLAALIRAWAYLGDRARAMEAVTELARTSPKVIPVRLTLGEALYSLSEFELSQQVFSQVLAVDPQSISAQIGVARAQMALYQSAMAKQTLMAIRLTSDETIRRNYALALAEYHTLVGEYGEAGHMYQELLRRYPSDDEIRLAYGTFLGVAYREHERAKAELLKIPPGSKYHRDARLEIASVLSRQRFFADAIRSYQQFLAGNPENATAMSGLVRVLGKAGDPVRAEALARGYLTDRERVESSQIAVRLALARVLLDRGEYQPAFSEYNIVLNRPRGRVTQATYGLARAAAKLKQPGRAEQVIAGVTSLIGGDTRNRLELADEYAADFDDKAAAAMCEAVLRLDPENLPALIRLLDAQVRSARVDANPRPAERTAQAILTQSPTNVRGLLGLARAHAVAQQFEPSIRIYEQLLTVDPSFNTARRERARILYGNKQFSAAAQAYAEAPAPAGLALQTDLEALILRNEKARQLVQPYVTAKLPGPALHAEIAKIASSTSDSDLQKALVGILVDHDARASDQYRSRLEGQAKAVKGLRDRAALPLYNELVRIEPTNTEALFDRGQVLAALTQTRRETQAYSDLLAVDPLHREGGIAWRRAWAELDPQYYGAFDLFAENGRNGLANITRMKYTNLAIIPFGDENEEVTLGYTRVLYNPNNGVPGLPGNIFTVGLTKKLHPDLLYFGTLNYEEYPDRLSSRPTFESGLRYFSDEGNIAGTLFLDNVVENSESLEQDIFRGGYTIGGNLNLTRFWTIGGNYRGAVYSDTNFMNEVFLISDYKVSLPPRQLQLVLDFDYLAYSQQSVFPPFAQPPDFITGVIHPYFAPDSFAITTGRMIWTHDLGRDVFIHADRCYYQLQYGLGFDSSFVVYHDLRARALYDITNRFTVGFQVTTLQSDVYDLTTVNAFMHIRFPVVYR